MVTFIQKVKGTNMDLNMAKNVGRAKFVKKARHERAWPQAQLAKVADVNLRTIQRLEKDGCASFHTLQGVAQAFGIDVRELNPTSSTKEQASSQKKVHLMPRLVSGKNLTHVVTGSDQFQLEHDDDDDQRSINAMKDILELLKGDVVRLYDADPVQRLDIEAELSLEIKGLEKHGYYIFGLKRVIPKIVGEQKLLIAMCTLYMSHSRSPRIVRDKNQNMFIPATLTEVVI